MSTQELEPDQLDLTESAQKAPHGVSPLFESLEVSQRLDLLRYLVENSDRIPLVQAPQGAGKSTLLQRFVAHPRSHWKPIQITADPLLQPDRLLTTIAHGLGDDVEPEQGLLERLLMRLQECQSRDLMVILLLDDAHLLPEASIIALLRLFERAQEAPGAFRLVFFAEDDFQRLLQAPQIQAMNLQQLQRLDLPRLDAQHCRAFVDYLLHREQLGERVNADDRRFELICREAGGLPGEVERRVLQLLKGGAITPLSKRQLTADLPGVALIGGGLVVLLILLTLLFQDEINLLFEATPESGLERMAPVAQESVVPLPLPERETTSMAESAGAVGAPKLSRSVYEASPDNPARPKISLPALSSPELTPPVPKVAVGTGPATTIDENAARADMESGVSPVTAEVAPPAGRLEQEVKQAAEFDEDLNAGAASVVERVAESSAARAPDEKPASHPGAGSDSKASSDARAVSAATGQPAKAPLRQARSTVSASSLPTTEVGDWILSQPRSGYSLQLIALQQESAARRFIAANRLSGKAYYFRSLRDGKPWYAVLYGVYPSRAAALAAKDKLPPSLRRGDAWPRSLASLQAIARER